MEKTITTTPDMPAVFFDAADEFFETIWVATKRGTHVSVFNGSSMLDFPGDLGATDDAVTILRTDDPLPIFSVA